MEKRCITAPGAPPAVGPYSHAVKADGFVFCSGQLPLAADGSGPRPGSFEEEARLALENLTRVLQGAGCSLADVVKTTIFLQDMERFARFNEIYSEFFAESKPARSCVEVARLPLGMQVEIEAIAYKPE
jgi:2-iminobutanoate/2-iminopropanoate deaminase